MNTNINDLNPYSDLSYKQQINIMITNDYIMRKIPLEKAIANITTEHNHFTIKRKLGNKIYDVPIWFSEVGGLNG